jgi:hypothetical protein
LWVAARLLKQVENWTLPLDGMEMMNQNEASTPIGQRRDALMARALALGAKDPMLAWIAHDSICPASPSVCRHADAHARLRMLAPSNAAAWWSVPAHGAKRADSPEELQQRLERIASASRFDTYESDLLRAVLRGLERTAVPPALLAPASPDAAPPTAASVRARAALEIHMADLVLDFDRQILVTCTAAGNDDAQRSLCEQVGRVAMGKAGNQLNYRLGACLLLALLPEGDARTTIIRHARVIAWQHDQLLALLPDEAAGDEWAQRQVECLVQPGASELACMSRFVRDSGRPLEPPPGWRARWESLPVGPIPAG